MTLEIPPGALMRDSDIGVTVLRSHKALRDKLPERVIPEGGPFVDIDGVFGEETIEPVTLRIPNVHGFPPGTRVPFGKIDHNTGVWEDLHEAEVRRNGGEETDLGLGFVTADGQSIEVQQ